MLKTDFFHFVEHHVLYILLEPIHHSLREGYRRKGSLTFVKAGYTNNHWLICNQFDWVCFSIIFIVFAIIIVDWYLTNAYIIAAKSWIDWLLISFVVCRKGRMCVHLSLSTVLRFWRDGTEFSVYGAPLHPSQHSASATIAVTNGTRSKRSRKSSKRKCCLLQ